MIIKKVFDGEKSYAQQVAYVHPVVFAGPIPGEF
jgi:hypothetical protein